MPHDRWGRNVHTICRCNHARPERAHWARQCKWPNRGREINCRAPPADDSGRRLWVSLVGRLVRGCEPRDWSIVPGLRDAGVAKLRWGSRVIVAIDGSAERGGWDDRVGAYGVAVGNLEHGDCMGGVDRTAYAAEE